MIHTHGIAMAGLAKDWAVSLDQAKETVERWYNDRPEVRKWQRETIEEARRTGYTKTLMGRWRKLDDINNRKYVSARHTAPHDCFSHTRTRTRTVRECEHTPSELPSTLHSKVVLPTLS